LTTYLSSKSHQRINEKAKSAQCHPGITIFEDNLSEQQKPLIAIAETDEVHIPPMPESPESPTTSIILYLQA
jgi:hypothetical protein